VAGSFAEIFFGNSTMIGLPCVTASAADLDRLMAAVEARPAEEFVLDLRAGQLAGPGLTVPVAIPSSARDAFLSGDWDATGLLLADYAAVERTASKLPYVSGSW
jgi:3-isopropylmalate/(R)-2-methylmalate dehydratase small subunit